MYTVQMDHTLTRSETRRKTNLAKHYTARIFEKKGGRPYARLREAVCFTVRMQSPLRLGRATTCVKLSVRPNG